MKKKSRQGKLNRDVSFLKAHDRLLREVSGIALFTLTALSVYAVALGNRGHFLWFLNDAYRTAMGTGAFLMPVLLLFLGLYLTMRKVLFAKLAAHAGIVMFLCAVTAHVTSMTFLTFGSRLDAADAARFCRFAEMQRGGGGFLGGLVACPMMRLLDWYGAYTALLAALLLYVKLLTRISYVEQLKRLLPHARRAWAFMKPHLVKVKPAIVAAARTAAAKIKSWRRAVEPPSPEPQKTLTVMPTIPCPIEPERFDMLPPPVRDASSASPDTALAESRKPPRRRDPKPKVQKDAELPLVPADAGEKEENEHADTTGGDLPAPIWKTPRPEHWLDPLESLSGSAVDDNMKMKLENALRNFQVPARISAVVKGATFTRFEIELEPGVRVSRVVSLENDIAIALAADSRTIRIEAPIPGKSAIGIEVPNTEVAIVPMRKMFMSSEFQKSIGPLTFVLGEDIAGQPVIANLSKMPHLLVAGSTNSGKSVCINSILCSIIARQRPEDVRFILVDQKRVELTPYEGIPHLLASVIQEAFVAANALKWVCGEMDRRYKLFAEMGVRNIDAYNQLMEDLADRLYRIVIVIDELADLMMVSTASMNVEVYICRIAQLARATGIHIILATQRPDTKVITGTIKNNIPSRISFAVASQIDSRTILDQKGAESLLGRGDMLYMPFDANKLVRLQGAFVKDHEVRRLVDFWKSQGVVEYPVKFALSEGGGGILGMGGSEFETEDEALYRKAVEIIVTSNQVSISLLQRKLRIGYNRSARLVDLMEERGVVGPYDGSKPREILISSAALANLEF